MIRHQKVTREWKRNRLRLLRAHRHMTQLELASRADIPDSRYWRIENGYRMPTPKEQTRLARALRFPTWALTREANVTA